jgi:hypothetical protein
LAWSWREGEGGDDASKRGAAEEGNPQAEEGDEVGEVVMAMREQDETPEYEAKSHSPRFLKKAAQLATKRGKGKGRAKKAKGGRGKKRMSERE